MRSSVRLRRRGAPFRLESRPFEVSDALENVEPERGAEKGRTGDDDPACDRDIRGLPVVRLRPLDPADEKSGLKGVEELQCGCGGLVRLRRSPVRLEMQCRQVGNDSW